MQKLFFAEQMEKETLRIVHNANTLFDQTVQVREGILPSIHASTALYRRLISGAQHAGSESWNPRLFKSCRAFQLEYL